MVVGRRIMVAIVVVIVLGGSAACTGIPPHPDDNVDAPVRVGLVSDIGGFHDGSFNQLADAGLRRAERQLGAVGEAVPTWSEADYVANLRRLARNGNDLVIGVGFGMADSVAQVALEYPDTNFAIIDVSQADLPGTPANVLGLRFDQSDAGYLAGYLAALVAADRADRPVISAVGGKRIPPVQEYLAGYRTGADDARPGIRVLESYSDDFRHRPVCRRLAARQIARDSQVVFAAAGKCGLGALAEAAESDVLGVGVDADQSGLGDHVLTSATKGVDVAVFDTIAAVDDGTFAGGRDVTFDLSGGGVGLGRVSAAGAPYSGRLERVARQIVAGEIDTTGR